jgi:hypothetical protein
MIELLRIHALVRMARALVFIGEAADLARAAACRKAGALAVEAAARMDARDTAYRARGDQSRQR